MKRILLIALCLSLTIFPVKSHAESPSSPVSSILIEVSTGQTLYSVNAEEKLPMASITKVMTLLVLSDMLDSGSLLLTDTVKASSFASSAEGSVIWLEAGEEMTAAELIEAVIISSANDACIALAEHTAGSEAQFVKLMNQRAKKMGLQNTHFTGCVGFDSDGHYSCAEDIALMTAELMGKEYYHGWFLTWLDYLRGGNTQLLNTNKLIRYYDGIVGGKTGTTDAAGCCLTVCAERGDMRLVAVVLGCEDDSDRFEKAEELLDYGFSSFEKFTPEIDSRQLISIPVERGEKSETKPMVKQPGECIIKKGRSGSVKYEYTFVEKLEAPVEKGQFMGEYLVTLDGIEVFCSDLVAREDIKRTTFGMYFVHILKNMLTF